MSAGAIGAGRLDVGRVVRRTLEVVGRDGVRFYLLALILGAVPAVLTRWVRFAGAAPTSGAIQAFTIGLASVVLALASLLAGVWLQASLFTGTVAALDGRRLKARELLRTTAAVITPLLGVTILNVLGLAVGFALLFVPGLILVTMWAVAAPVAALERPGVFAAFRLSAQLTKGRRWAILGLLILAGLVFGVVGVVTQFTIASLFYGGSRGVSPINLALFGVLQAHGPLAFVGALVSASINAFYVMVVTIGIGVLYYELRTLRDGESPEDLATVFA